MVKIFFVFVYFISGFVLDIVTRVNTAIAYANHVVSLASPQLRVMESFENIEINETLLHSLTDLTLKGSGFFVMLGTNRSTYRHSHVNVNESTIYLGCLELDLFYFLDRHTSKSNALFEISGDKKQIVLFVQLNDKVGSRDFTCVIPLTKEYDMVRDDSMYNDLNEYVNFVYATTFEENKRIYQLAFSCLPLLDGYTKSVEIHENIFRNYFKRARFASEILTFTTIYRIYTHEISFGLNSYAAVNYVLLQYDASDDLFDYNGHVCFSTFLEDSGIGDEVLASKCYDNSVFQLVIIYGSKPKAQIQFFLHVTHDVFNSFLENCIEEDYGNDELFESESDDFTVHLFCRSQKNRNKNVFLSLVEQSLLSFFISLYRGRVTYEAFYAYVLTVCYRVSVFEKLSMYIFTNLFQLVSDNFGSFDEIYCILFTCIVLSDVTSVRVTSKVFNGGLVSIIYYFYSLYCMIVCNETKAQRVVQRNKGVEFRSDWEIEANHHFGLHMKPFGPNFNNFLAIRHDYLVEHRRCKRTLLSCACINLSILKSEERV